MKKLALLTIALTLCIASNMAQSYMVVDSKKIFDSLPEYNQALADIDNIGKEYQAQVDAKYNEVETMYNNMQRQNNLSSVERGVYQARIEKLEAEAQRFQEAIFSQNGTFVKRRVEILTPIQERVFGVIESYAKSRNIEMVLDEASTPTVIYCSPSVNHTSAIIEQLKKQ